MFFGAFLHVLFRSPFLLRFVDIGIPATSISGVCEAIDLNLACPHLEFEERFGKVPTSELQLLADHAGYRYLLLAREVLPVELFQYVLHLLIGLYFGYAHLPQLA